MNKIITNNYKNINGKLLLIPLILLAGIAVWLYSQNSLSPIGYVEIQKPLFLFLNTKLSQLANFQHNTTQLGDAFIILSMLSIFIWYAPKLWEALLSASLISLVFSKGLKELFDVPRPATIFDNEAFTIIGKTAVGYSSMPSGHTITIFTTLTVMLFAFTPKRLNFKSLWILFIVLLGYVLAFTRVGVGAHHPLDVVIGSVLGFASGVLGILADKKFRLFAWISNEKSRPFFVVLFAGSLVFLVVKIVKEPLPIYFLPLISLLVSLFILTKSYVQKIKN